MSDPINPTHYQGKDGVQLMDVLESFDLHLNYNRGNAIKYLFRADMKGNRVQDLKKAIWHIQREIDRHD